MPRSTAPKTTVKTSRRKDSTKTKKPEMDVLQVVADAVRGAARVSGDSQASQLVAEAISRLQGVGVGAVSFFSCDSTHGQFVCVRNCEAQCLIAPADIFSIEGELGTIGIEGITEFDCDGTQILGNPPCQLIVLEEEPQEHVLLEMVVPPGKTQVGAQRRQAAAIGHVRQLLGMV